MAQSKAINTNDPKYSKLSIGVCPDQWGVWFPEDEKQMDPGKLGKKWQKPASKSSKPGHSVISPPIPKNYKNGAMNSE